MVDSVLSNSKNQTFSVKEKPKMLFFGMPEADSSYWSMNIAQAPQGPTLQKLPFLPDFIGGKINARLKYIFNPRKKAPYVGMHLIKQNLEKDIKGGVDITLIDYPTEKKNFEDGSENPFYINWNGNWMRK